MDNLPEELIRCDPYETEPIATQILNKAIRNGYLFDTQADLDDVFRTERFIKCFFPKTFSTKVLTANNYFTGLEWHLLELQDYEFASDYLVRFLDD